MTSILTYISVLAKGSCITLIAWLLAGTFSIVIGIGLGTVSCKNYAHPILRFFIGIYTFIAKGIPAYVQILIAYFVIPNLLGINISGFCAAIGALAFCSGGYVTAIIRASINNIPQGQWDAAFVLGYPLSVALWRIILPQALHLAHASLFGELEQLLKSTSLLATIGVTELTRTGMNIISRELNPLPIYGIIALLYLLFSTVLYLVSINIEKRTSYGYR
ncbi:MAG TPA: amino acid ABC transporter permease [Candidatus Babeliales bacterium]|jgi:His/Glu/Gln/Arg/opine family amino acid ABC transporter permease subunit|nr:amino acid ABC transporter permease [Candidatus Babeliales bacterium]